MEHLGCEEVNKYEDFNETFKTCWLNRTFFIKENPEIAQIIRVLLEEAIVKAKKHYNIEKYYLQFRLDSRHYGTSLSTPLRKYKYDIVGNILKEIEKLEVVTFLFNFIPHMLSGRAKNYFIFRILILLA